MPTLSAKEVEYIATSFLKYYLLWLYDILDNLKHVQEGLTTLLYDNSSIILTLKGLLRRKRKHILIEYHFL